jgi:hypothetical protein
VIISRKYVVYDPETECYFAPGEDGDLISGPDYAFKWSSLDSVNEWIRNAGGGLVAHRVTVEAAQNDA